LRERIPNGVLEYIETDIFKSNLIEEYRETPQNSVREEKP